METVKAGLTVICLCAVIALVLFLVMRGGSVSEYGRKFMTLINGRRRIDDQDGWDRRKPSHRGGGSGHTVVSTKLFVDQLDEDLSTVIHSFPIGEISKHGVSISRPGAVYGTVKLRDAGHCAHTVSEEHARIGHDTDGFYIQEREGGTTNGMFLRDGISRIEEASITDGLILYLGEQPIRFRFPKRKATHVKDDRDPERPAYQTNIMRRRNS